MAGQCTQYFEAMGVPDEKKVLWAAMALKGDALNLWFSWKGSNERVTRWTFENAVLKGFQPEVGLCSRFRILGARKQIGKGETKENKAEEVVLESHLRGNQIEAEVEEKIGTLWEIRKGKQEGSIERMNKKQQ